MSKAQPPEPLDFFIWTVEDVGRWLEEINLGSYRQIFKENGVNGEYLESMSTFTTEQILRFIRKCHMKWGDFITLCKELRRIKAFSSGMLERQSEGPEAMVGSIMPLDSLCEVSEAEQTIEGCFTKARTMTRDMVCGCKGCLVEGK